MRYIPMTDLKKTTPCIVSSDIQGSNYTVNIIILQSLKMAGFKRMPNRVWSKLEITEGLKKNWIPKETFNLKFIANK